MSDLPDFLGGEPTPEPEAVAAPETPETAPPEAPAAEGPARGPDGKFVPATPEPVAEPAPAAPPTEPEQPHQVPLATFLDLRDKHTAAEKRANELQAWRDQQEAAARRQPPPDPNEDPAAYEAHRQAQIHSELYDQRLDMSRSFAELKHGPDVTKAAYEWGLQRCDQDPYFNDKVRNSRDPVGVVVAEWKREQLVSRLDPNDIDAFQQWKAAQAGAPAGPTPAASAAPPQRPAAPRPSLAAGPSAGNSNEAVPRDGAEQFGAMFGP